MYRDEKDSVCADWYPHDNLENGRPSSYYIAVIDWVLFLCGNRQIIANQMKKLPDYLREIRMSYLIVVNQRNGTLFEPNTLA